MQHTLRWRRRALIALSLLLATAAAAFAALYTWALADLPPVASVELRATYPTTQILDRNGKLLYEVMDPAAGKQIDLDLDKIPRACVEATLATEDARFFYHPGVDPLAIARALWQNLNGRTVVSGGSTLTQQLARNLLLDADERFTQSLRRKAREAWLAAQLEWRYSKDELLALYLNQTYYGNFAFGLEAAAQVFFAKPAQQLSTAECALLAGLVQYPTGYNPLADPETARNRQLTVLRLMRQAGYLDEAAAAQVAAEPLQYRSHLFAIEAPHFVMYVQDQLASQLGADRLRQGGLRVTTTLDLDLQRQAEAAVRRRLAQLTCRDASQCTDQAARDRRAENAAAVVLDSQNGAILAMVGSPDYFDQAISGNVNASLSLRQPGSAIKPFTYAAALDPAWSSRAGQPPLTPASILPDLPATFYVEDVDGSMAAYRPRNYDGTFHGPVSVRTALANSYNIPAVEVLDRVGVDTLRELAAQAGIRTFTGRYGLALTLGGGDVRLLELTAAYGILDDGVAVAPWGIVQVEEQPRGNEEELSTGKRKLSIVNSQLSIVNEGGAGAHPFTIHNSLFTIHNSNPIIAPQVAYLLTDILADDVARQPAFGRNSVLNLPFPAAVKTGTTTDWRDNWTVGYSTRRIVGVWVGNADNSPMVDVSGVDGAGPIWHDLMRLAHATPPPPFTRPEGIEETSICAPSGLLPSPACPRTRTERFLAGTTPRQADNQFQRLAVDAASGDLATDATPASRQVERVFWLLPPEYHDWMVGQGIAIAPVGNAELSTVNSQQSTVNGSTGAPPFTIHNSPFTIHNSPPALPPDVPLLLTSPASFTTYQLHPGLAGESQRLEVAGYAAGGRAWHSLRLMVDGTPLATTSNGTRLSAWWTMTLGAHRFWLEGERTPGAATERSATAEVTAEAFREEEVRLVGVR